MTGQSVRVGSPETSSHISDSEIIQEQAQVPRDQVDGEVSSDGSKIAEKFFVVKSLTLQDLELSTRNGIWATQAHNEAALNKAYEVGQATPVVSRLG